MKKAIAVVIGVLALTFATTGAAFAAGGPTQSGYMTCSKLGTTTFTSTTGAVSVVYFSWKNNNGSTTYGGSDSSAPYSKATPNTAKTGYTTVQWESGLQTTYSKACT